MDRQVATSSITGLDYYNARYYDPGVGQFLSVDSVQGNAQGMDPYAYVGGNPESRTDPTGNLYNCVEGCGGGSSTPTSGCGPCHDPNKPWPGSGNGSSAGSGGGTTTKPQPTVQPTRPTNGGSQDGGNGVGGSHNKPTRDQINNAKSVANSAVSYFAELALGAGFLATSLFFISKLLIQWGAQILLASEGPWAFLTIPLGLSLLALGALASVIAWQATRVAAMLGVLSLMYSGENRMSDSWWTPATVEGFANAARIASTAASITVAALSFISKLPGKIPASLLSQAGVEGAFLTGRTLGVSVGMLNAAAIDHQIDYYTGLEVTCLTQSSCVTN